ncbi:restriction endonuclease [Kitasatospora purpeofusca]|uniref:restriction endonuclease n=1 Tax=Kitasatospora purpeofusca TaxID=67352 RepID=UPI0036D420AC
MGDPTIDLVSRLAALDDHDVLNRYAAEAATIARHGEFLPLVLTFLHRAAEGGPSAHSPWQYRERIHAASASIEMLLQIIDDTRGHIDLVRKDATSVMSACAIPLADCRTLLTYFLAKEERRLVGLRRGLAELEWDYWDSRLRHCPDAAENQPPLRKAPLIERPKTLHRIAAEITHSSTEIVDLLKKQPPALFEPTSSVPIALVDKLEPKPFERLVSALMQRDGFSILRANGFSGDHAADVIALWPINQRFVVQVKHTTRGRKVDRGVVMEFESGANRIHHADFAVIVTNGDFTQGAISTAEDLEVLMVNRIDLVRWVELGDSLIDILTSD